MNALHEESGVGVSPVRTESATLVPAGVPASHESAPQATREPASRTREVKVPEDAYGVTRSQSTLSVPPRTVKSLVAAFINPERVASVATTLPSIQYVKPVVRQSIR